MLSKIIYFFIKNKSLALLLVLLLISLGYVFSPFQTRGLSDFRAPVSVDALPDLGENQQIVMSSWAGHNPQEVEDQITYPLTSLFLSTPGVKTVRSSSLYGLSMIQIVFEDEKEYYWSRSRLLERLSSLESGLLPLGVSPSLGPDATGLGQIFWYTLEARDSSGQSQPAWSLDELRSIQDYYVKPLLSAVKGVAEVSSVGGFVKEYRVDLDPSKLESYEITLLDVQKAIQSHNSEFSAQTFELNKVEYFIRGTGYLENLNDIGEIPVSYRQNRPVYLSDIAKIYLGPESRNGVLDRGGREAVGGVVVARYGENPQKVIQEVKNSLSKIEGGLPVKNISEIGEVKLSIEPFYDRSLLIKDTLKTLEDALSLELLISLIVMLFMLRGLRVSFLVSSMLPLSLVLVFGLMYYLGIEANIVALSGIAIAIGSMVDMGVILVENIVRNKKLSPETEDLDELVFQSSMEVAPALLTAMLTTVLSFIPVFILQGAEGKLFTPLAWTKSLSLVSAFVISVLLIPSFAAALLKRENVFSKGKPLFSYFLIALGLGACFLGQYWTLILAVYGLIPLLSLSDKKSRNITLGFSLLVLFLFLAKYWMPFGVETNKFLNFAVVSISISIFLVLVLAIYTYYENLLRFALKHRQVFLLIPLFLIVAGYYSFSEKQSVFMPTLNEGSFLLMPSSPGHTSIEQNKKYLADLDRSISGIPEVLEVVGKLGRVESALDPAPISMFENVINLKPEYSEQKDGSFLRNWRPHIHSVDDIWDEIVRKSKYPGLTAVSKLQPIETRLLMLQSGIRSRMAIKVSGTDILAIESFSKDLESFLKKQSGVNRETVFWDRTLGKPYLNIEPKSDVLARYGLPLNVFQDNVNIAVNGIKVSEIYEGRERYNLKLAYPKGLYSNLSSLRDIPIPIDANRYVPLSELAEIQFEKGPQSIKSEDGFLINHVLFDKEQNIGDLDLITDLEEKLRLAIADGSMETPPGITFEFTGTYLDQVRAEGTLKIVIPIVFVLIVLVLYRQFKSLLTTFMIFSAILTAFGGGFILLSFFTEVQLSVAVWVGFIALFGIATDDGVLIATFLNKTFSGVPLKSNQQIQKLTIEAGKKRIRACLMTTATTLIALLPVLSSSGKGSEIMIPMAIPIFGGMLASLISLFIVPVFYAWRAERKLKYQK